MPREITYRYCTGCQLDLGSCECGEIELPDLFDHEGPEDPYHGRILHQEAERPRKGMRWRGNSDFLQWHLSRKQKTS